MLNEYLGYFKCFFCIKQFKVYFKICRIVTSILTYYLFHRFSNLSHFIEKLKKKTEIFVCSSWKTRWPKGLN